MIRDPTSGSRSPPSWIYRPFGTLEPGRPVECLRVVVLRVHGEIRFVTDGSPHKKRR
jgi:hypothetical protein